MSYVFISYSRQDKACVESLAFALSQRGISAWYDADCVAFMVIMSPDAAQAVSHPDDDSQHANPQIINSDQFGVDWTRGDLMNAAK